MSSDTSQQLEAGLAHHQSGRLKDAENIYRSVLAEHPQHPDALHLLGVIALQTGNYQDAAKLIEHAIEAKPDEAEFYNMSGETYRALHQYDVAIARYEKALALRPDFAGAHNNLGNTFVEMRRFEDAVACYQKSIAIDPGFPMSHNNLGIALKELGRSQEAIAHHKQAIAIMPAYAEAHSSLGNALEALGRPEEAISHHEQALAIRPDFAEAHSNLGNSLKELGRVDEAITHYKQALEIQPGFAMAHYNLGIALDEMGQPAEAASCYERALAINPDYAEAHHNYANTLDELGRREDAVTHYEQALAIKPDYAEAYRNLSRINADQKKISAVEKLLEDPSLSESDAIHCHFALGNIYHKLKNFNKAFEHYDRGNTLKRNSLSYDSHDFTSYVDRLIDTYSESYFQAISACGSASTLPVFIIGMPRSGTSLVEQIVSSHPQVHGAGELASLGRYEKSIAAQFEDTTTYPECMPQCYESVATEFSDKYLDELRRYSHDAQRITDKMPDNFMRIGLIKTLFPDARIIHCRRNALDTCTSNFLNYFAIGNEYSFDLDDLGKYYLDYDRLMAHWDGLFSSKILTVQYEELVMQQEEISRQLVEYLGLEWDERCLNFYENQRPVHNFSSMDVRQPIYERSIDRWKIYERQLARLIVILN
ncbi:MAG: tetratricopeptide repeat-containing sulfotransferase family protein [Woeseiaceae bacterium]